MQFSNIKEFWALNSQASQLVSPQKPSPVKTNNRASAKFLSPLKSEPLQDLTSPPPKYDAPPSEYASTPAKPPTLIPTPHQDLTSPPPKPSPSDHASTPSNPPILIPTHQDLTSPPKSDAPPPSDPPTLIPTPHQDSTPAPPKSDASPSDLIPTPHQDPSPAPPNSDAPHDKSPNPLLSCQLPLEWETPGEPSHPQDSAPPLLDVTLNMPLSKETLGQPDGATITVPVSEPQLPELIELASLELLHLKESTLREQPGTDCSAINTTPNNTSLSAITMHPEDANSSMSTTAPDASASESQVSMTMSEDEAHSKWLQMLDSKRTELIEMRQKKLAWQSADSGGRRRTDTLMLDKGPSRSKCPSAPPDLALSPPPSRAFPRSMSFSSNYHSAVNTSNSSDRSAPPSPIPDTAKSTRTHSRRLSFFSSQEGGGLMRSASRSLLSESSSTWSLGSLWSRSSPVPSPTTRRNASGTNSSNKYTICNVEKSEIVFSGQLQKKNTLKRWKKRWIVLTKCKLFCFKSDASQKAKTVELRLSTFKSDPSTLLFWIVTPSQTHYFSVESMEKFLEWSQKITLICNGLMLESIENSHAVDGNSAVRIELEELLARPDNATCADCGNRNPQWASISIGVFLCIECSGIHRGLGVSISKVRSVVLDLWEPEWVKRMQMVGNGRANETWEAKLHPSMKPSESATAQQREDFIRRKYIYSAFKAADPNNPVNAPLDLCIVRDVFVYFDGEEECVGFVEVDISKQLLDLRRLMLEEGITSPAQQSFRFLFKRAPVTEKQESKKRILDCMVERDDSWCVYLRKSV